MNQRTTVPGAGGPDLLVLTLQDVTARRRGEERLRDSEERFRSVFEHAATAIGITDPGGRFVQCNPAYCGVLGRTSCG